MRAVIVLLLLAGCVAPAPETATEVPEVPDIPFPELRDLPLAPLALPTHECSDSQPQPDAGLLPPFDAGAEAIVQVVARGLNLDLTGATAEPSTNVFGDSTGWRIEHGDITIRVEPSDESPSPVVVTLNNTAWWGSNDEAWDQLQQAIDPDQHLHKHAYGAEPSSWSANSNDTVDGWVSGATYTWRGYPVSTITMYPLQTLDATPGNAALRDEAALRFATCAEIPGDLTETVWKGARHGIQAWLVEVKQPNPDHHCGGPAWMVWVSIASNDAFGIEQRSCY